MPCRKDKKRGYEDFAHVPWYGKPKKGDIWPLLVEKAAAKLRGGYANTQRMWEVEAFSMLTGTWDAESWFRREGWDFWRMKGHLAKNWVERYQ